MGLGRPRGPPARRVMIASHGRAKARRQNPEAAGPVPVSRTSTPEKPMTQAPNTKAPIACQRGLSAGWIVVSAKPQLRPQLLRRHTGSAQLAQRLRAVAFGIALAVR